MREALLAPKVVVPSISALGRAKTWLAAQWQSVAGLVLPMLAVQYLCLVELGLRGVEMY
jgi:hypothetical protein